MSQPIDFTLQDEGSIWILRTHTPAAEQWVDENVDPEVIKWGDGYVIEWRYIQAIAQGMRAEGLVMEGDDQL